MKTETATTTTHVGYRWHHHCDDTGGIVVIGAATKSNLALTVDTAESESLSARGSVGHHNMEVVSIGLVDGEPAVVDIIDVDDDNDYEQPADWPRGESIPLDDILAIEGAKWDGNNHVVFNALNARQFAAETCRDVVSGPLTFVYDDNGDSGGEALFDIVTADGWTQVCYYWDGWGSDGAGVHPSKYDELGELLTAMGIDFHHDGVSNGASNEPCEAYAFAVADEHLKLAETIVSRLVENEGR